MTNPLLVLSLVLSCALPVAAQETAPPAEPAPAPAPAPATPKAQAPAPATPAMGQLVVARALPFRQGETMRVDALVGPLRVPELRVTPDEANLLREFLPPRGGVKRFSYLRYSIAVENPTGTDWTLGARIRLLDRNGAVIDEFEFRGGVDGGRARLVELKRLTLNYVVPLIDRIELTMSAER